MMPPARGEELARALVGLMRGYYPSCLAGTPVALIRYLAGDRCAALRPRALAHTLNTIPRRVVWYAGGVPMATPGSVTCWLDLLRAGDPAAAQKLWEGYFRRLVGLARARLRAAPRRAADEEDVAL